MSKKSIEVGKELVKRIKNLNNNIESIMGNSVKSYENMVYKIGNRGDQINLNIRNNNYELICWYVDDHYQYQNPPNVYVMSKNEMKGLADFINKYLENN